MYLFTRFICLFNFYSLVFYVFLLRPANNIFYTAAFLTGRLHKTSFAFELTSVVATTKLPFLWPEDIT